MSENPRKRGRKLRDNIDDEIRESQSKTLRGLRFLRSHTEGDIEPDYKQDRLSDVEKTVADVLSREIQLVKERLLFEIRETVSPVQTKDESVAVLGSPVAVRMLLCQFSIANCVENSFRQIFHATRHQQIQANRCVALTPECHILLSKACEQMIIDITTRACLDAECTAGSARITSTNILRSLSTVSRKWGHSQRGAQFSFAQDAIDRSLHLPLHPLDQIATLHR